MAWPKGYDTPGAAGDLPDYMSALTGLHRKIGYDTPGAAGDLPEMLQIRQRQQALLRYSRGSG